MREVERYHSKDKVDASDDTFRIHCQEWRSEEMTALFEELDRYADAVTKIVHQKQKHVIGAPKRLGLQIQQKNG